MASQPSHTSQGATALLIVDGVPLFAGLGLWPTCLLSTCYVPVTVPRDTQAIAHSALAGAAIELRPVNQKVPGSISSQGICLGRGPGPQQGACERH